MREMKGCSFCGKSIPLEAIECPHCQQGNRQSATHFCTQCGSLGLPKHYSAGSFVVAGLLLVLSFALPILFLGLLVYVVWWALSSYTGCSQCAAKTLIPSTSPIAQASINSKTSSKANS
jgi:hypothetical protein